MSSKTWLVAMCCVCACLMAAALPASAQSRNPSAVSVDNEVLGRNVTTRNNQMVGQIDDAILDRQGRIDHYLVDIGNGQKTVALNPDQLHFTGQDFVFNGSRSDIDRMPAVNPYEWGSFGYYGRSQHSPGAASQTYGSSPGQTTSPRYYSESYGGYGGGPYQGQQQEEYYEQQPYSQPYSRQYPPSREYYEGGMGPGGVQQQGMNQGRMMQRPEPRMMTRGISADVLLSGQIVDPQYRTIGEIDDLVLDPRTRRVTQVVVGVRDKEVLVPFRQLRRVGADTVMYRGSIDQLDQMPEFALGAPQESRAGAAGHPQPQAKPQPPPPPQQSGQPQPQGHPGQQK